MYISRMMKKYTTLAGIPSYSAESLRNSCAYTMFAYDAKPEQVAREMGVTESQIRRYKNMNYMDNPYSFFLSRFLKYPQYDPNVRPFTDSEV